MVPGAHVHVIEKGQQQIAIVDYKHESNRLRFINVDEVFACFDELGFAVVENPSLRLRSASLVPWTSARRTVVCIGPRPAIAGSRLWQGVGIFYCAAGLVVRPFALFAPGDLPQRPLFQTRFAVDRMVFVVQIP